MLFAVGGRSSLAFASTAVYGVILFGCLGGCARTHATADTVRSLDSISRSYVELVVAIGERDPDSIDYYYGSEAWVSKIRKDPPTLGQIEASAFAYIQTLKQKSFVSPIDEGRREFLVRQLSAVECRAELLRGGKPTFDQETEAFFGIHVPPSSDQQHLAELRAELDILLPGNGNLTRRYAAFEQGFMVSPQRLPTVMRRAVEGCRAQTIQHIQLPPGERIELAYVHNRSWSAFSRYEGNFHSLVQINTDFGLTVDRALQLACHEAYPGHHVYNSLRDLHQVREEQRIEFMAQPTFSPQSFASEAAATFAVEAAFPPRKRAAFERDALFPLAGIDAKKAERYCRIERLVDQLHTAEPAIARDFLDGRLEFVRAARALEEQALMAGSDDALKYINEYRSYITTYTFGRDLVAQVVDRRTEGEVSEEVRWQRYLRVMTSVEPIEDLGQQRLQAATSTMRGEAAERSSNTL